MTTEVVQSAETGAAAVPDPFLLCTYHSDTYPPGDEDMGISGVRGSGADFDAEKVYRMYHGNSIPGFPQHGHLGIEIITGTIEGVIDHADSCGNAARYGGGDVQIMTAGAGIRHSEMFPLLRDSEPNRIKCFQLWINMPSSDKLCPPNLQTRWAEEIPKWNSDDGMCQIKFWVGSAFGVDPLPVAAHSWAANPANEVGVWLVQLDAGGGGVDLPPLTNPRANRTVIVFTHAYGERTGVRYMTCGLKIYYIPTALIVRQVVAPSFFGVFALFRQVLLREKIEIVHGHQVVSTLVHMCTMHARTMGYRVIYTDHSLYGFADAAAIHLNKLMKFTMLNVDHAICVSHTCRENLVLRAAMDPRIVSAIPNAVDHSRFTPDPARRKVIGGAGTDLSIVILSRLVYRKGIDLVVDVIPRICRMFENVNFIIGGDGPKKLKLLEMREKHQLHDRVEMLGLVPNARVCDVLNRGHIFLNCSLTESFCIAILEAASCGLFVVSTKVGGVPEVLPPEMIRFAEEVSSEALVRALADVIPVANRVIPEEFHSRVRDMYSWDDVAARTERVYRKVSDLPEERDDASKNLKRITERQDIVQILDGVTKPIIASYGFGGHGRVKLSNLVIEPPEAVAFVIVVEASKWGRWRGSSLSPRNFCSGENGVDIQSDSRISSGYPRNPVYCRVPVFRLCSVPALVRQRAGDGTGGASHLVKDVSALGLYSVQIVTCRGDAIRVKGTISLMNSDHHLSDGQRWLPEIFAALSLFYFSFLLAWGRNALRQYQRLRVNSLAFGMGAVLVSKTLYCTARWIYYAVLSSSGTDGTGLMVLHEALDATWRVLFHLLLILASLGYELVRPHLTLREGKIVACVFTLYFILSLVNDLCGVGTHSAAEVPEECITLELSEYIARALITLVAIVVLNVTVSTIRRNVGRSTWIRGTAANYRRLRSFRDFRWAFLVYLIMPTILLIYKYSVLSSRYDMLHIFATEMLGMYVNLKLAFLIAPAPWMYSIYDAMERVILGNEDGVAREPHAGVDIVPVDEEVEAYVARFQNRGRADSD
eukprot:g4836.t1